jgi:ubiquitin-conjugating enzyme E2 C
MDIMTKPTPGITAFPDDENMTVWTATIDGPADTPYANLVFKLSMEFASNYPYSPPTVLYKTPIYHPNVDFSGRICLDILKDKWSAIYNITTVLLSLQSLLGEPNKWVSKKEGRRRKSCWRCYSSSPLNGQAAELWDKDPEEYKRLVLARHKAPEELDAWTTLPLELGEGGALRLGASDPVRHAVWRHNWGVSYEPEVRRHSLELLGCQSSDFTSILHGPVLLSTDC